MARGFCPQGRPRAAAPAAQAFSSPPTPVPSEPAASTADTGTVRLTLALRTERPRRHPRQRRPQRRSTPQSS